MAPATGKGKRKSQETANQGSRKSGRQQNRNAASSSPTEGAEDKSLTKSDLLSENEELKRQLAEQNEASAQKLLEAGAKNDGHLNTELVERLNSLTKLQVFRFCKFLSGIGQAKVVCKKILESRFPEYQTIEDRQEKASASFARVSLPDLFGTLPRIPST